MVKNKKNAKGNSEILLIGLLKISSVYLAGEQESNYTATPNDTAQAWAVVTACVCVPGGSQLPAVSVVCPPCTLIGIQAYICFWKIILRSNLHERWLYFTTMLCHTGKLAHTEPYGVTLVTAHRCQYSVHYVPVPVQCTLMYRCQFSVY